MSRIEGARPSAATRHFAGALVSKLTPSAVQLLLLLAMARLGTLEDVGRLALASAASFTCGSLAEFGFGTSLSVPRAYFGTDLPPLRGTRGARVGVAVAGSALYVLLWVGGLGGHELPFLVLTPLPALLALSYGYAGVMNAESGLDREGRVTVTEAVLTILGAGLLLLIVEPLVAALLGLLLARTAGTALRARMVRGLPQAPDAPERSAVRTQVWFVLASTVLVINGQIDVLAAGFVSAFATLAVFSPLMRTAYSLSLVAEALSWSLYGRAGSEPAAGSAAVRFIQNWSRAAPILGVFSACVFVLTAQWFIPLILDRPVDSLLVPVLLFGGVIVVRFVGFSYGLQIARAGRQRARLPGLLLAMVVLLASGVGGALSGSLTVLAAGRLCAEIVVATAYAAIVRRGLSGAHGATSGGQRAFT